MTATPHFHVAVEVRDLDAAMARFSEVLGLDFYPPTTVRSVAPDDPAGPAVDRKATYSRQGPPFLELIETRTVSGDELDPHAAAALLAGEVAGFEGFHHVGFFVPNLHERIEQLQASGLVEERHNVTPDGRVNIWINDPASFFGTRLELFDAGMEPYFSAEQLEKFFSAPVRTRLAHIARAEQPPDGSPETVK